MSCSRFPIGFSSGFRSELRLKPCLYAIYSKLRRNFCIVLIACLLTSFRPALAQNPVPFVNQPLAPGAVVPGGAGFTLTVHGTGFVSGATVDWNGTPLSTTFVSASQLTATVPLANIASAGTAFVTVVNPGTIPTSNVVFLPVVSPTSTVFYANASGSPIALGGPAQTPNEALAMAAGDFSGTGKLDLAVAIEEAHNPGNLNLFQGNGNGTFTLLPSPGTVGVDPSAIAAGDFNGDGTLDLAVANFDDNTVSVLLNNGNGTFTATPAISVGINPAGLAVADFNGDGKLDLAVANSGSNTVTILLGAGNGTFLPVSSSPATGLSPFGLAVGDFNRDGKLDLAVSNFDQNVVTVLLGNGDGTFTPAPSPAATGGPAIAAEDFNGDGKLDLAVTTRGNSTVTILLGNGDGTFAPVSGCCGVSVDPSRTLAMATGDFNGDGKPDLALAIENTEGLGLANYIAILLGNGDGTFTQTDFALLLLQEPFSLVVGDFNRDGQLDFATGSNPLSSVSVLAQGGPPGGAQDFSVTATSTLSVQAGATATGSISISSLNSFLGAVSLTCSGAPSLATCSIAQSSVGVFDGATITFNFTVTTTAPSSTSSLSVMGAASATTRSGAPLGLWAALLGAISVLTLIWTRRRPSRVAIGAALLGIVLLAGCGGGGSTPTPPNNPSPGTPPGSYTLTVKGTSGSLTHSTTVTLTVTQ